MAAFNASQSGFNDAFKPSASAFEDSFENKATAFGDDDSWHGNSWNNQSHDPFGGSSKPDPFAAAPTDFSARDVSQESFRKA